MTVDAIGKVRRPPFQRFHQFFVGLFRVSSLDDFALKVLPILAKLRMATATAVLLRAIIHPMTPPRHRGAKRLLILKKAIFVDDVMASFADVDDVQIFGLSRGAVKSMAAGFLPPELRDENNYTSDDPEAVARHSAYRRFFQHVWHRLAWLGGFDGVMSGNWVYYAERDLHSALEGLGVPFLVLHKEGLLAPATSSFLSEFAKLNRGAFGGRRLLIYHDVQRHHLLQGELAREDQ